jgi:hypothetical protein
MSETKITVVFCNPITSKIYVGDSTGCLRIIEVPLSGGKEARLIGMQELTTFEITGIEMTPCREFLIIAYETGLVILYDEVNLDFVT